MNAFEEARKELIRILAHHMVLLAERVHIIENQEACEPILENAHRIWSEKAVFKWEVVPSDGLEDFGRASGSPSNDYTVSGAGMLELTFPSEEQLSKSPSYDVACDSISPSHIVPLDNPLATPVSRDIGTTCDPILGRCFSCSTPLDANGLCLFCLDPALMGESTNHQDDCLQDPTLFQDQNSSNICSSPYLEDQWALMDPLWSRIESMGETSAESSGPLGQNLSPICPNLPRKPSPAYISSFSMLENNFTPTNPTYGLPEFASPEGASADPGPGNQSSADFGYGEGNVDPSKLHTRDSQNLMPIRKLKQSIRGTSRKSPTLENPDPVTKVPFMGTCISCNSIIQSTKIDIKAKHVPALTCEMCGRPRRQKLDLRAWNERRSGHERCVVGVRVDELKSPKSHKPRLKTEDARLRVLEKLLV